jgi:hypothetical protein
MVAYTRYRVTETLEFIGFNTQTEISGCRNKTPKRLVER